MDALASVLVSLVAGSAWAPGALAEGLLAAQQRAHLPVAALAPFAAGVEVAFHRQAGLPMAYLHPPSGRRPPRLALYAPFYLRGRTLVPIEELRLDVSEYLFHALLVGWLDAAWRGKDPVGERLAARAAEVMAEVPPAARLEAFVDALASFGSHALAIANEVAGKAARGGEARARLRRLAATEAPLFALWRRVHAGEPYPGSYVVPAGVAGAGEVRLTVSVPLPEDKRFLGADLLGAGWTGDPVRDFAAVLAER